MERDPRFETVFKSAAFPILLVVILAFVAQRRDQPDSGETADYNEFLTMVDGARSTRSRSTPRTIRRRRDRKGRRRLGTPRAVLNPTRRTPEQSG